MLPMSFPSRDTCLPRCAALARPHLEGFAHALHHAGYAARTTQSYLRAAAHLGLWLEQAALPWARCDEAIVTQFQQHLPTCRCPGRSGPTRRTAVFGVRCFLHYLRHAGVVPCSAPPVAPDEPQVLRAFGQWMEQHRGVRRSTLEGYSRIVRALLQALGEDPAQFRTPALRQFVLTQTQRYGRHQAKAVVTATRMFVRYLIIHGACAAALEGAIPTVARWRLEALPPYLPADTLAQIIAACDPATPIGARDHAILLLLSRLALRAGDVASLRLSHLDWAAASLRLLGKERRETCLPLPQDVGDAILTYLAHGRPPYHEDYVFLRTQAPRGPLTRQAITKVVARAMRRADVSTPSYGAHILRHSAATALLHQGSSLEVVAAVLRHRSVDTTAHYAKVDVALLREVAQPWPEVRV